MSDVDTSPAAVLKARQALNKEQFDAPFREHPVSRMIGAIVAERDSLQAKLKEQKRELDRTKHGQPDCPGYLQKNAMAELQAKLDEALKALEKIASRHVTEKPLWWQKEARTTLSKIESKM